MVGATPMENKMQEVRLRWFGHAKRRSAFASVRRCERLTRVGLRRGKGRPKKYWSELVSRWSFENILSTFSKTRLSIFGKDFSVSLISRRSRHFAGTRYLKRGVNDHGRVANDVETEQIVLDEEAGSCKGKMSSVVQMRGSIPLFWSQEASRFSPKPDIICGVIYTLVLTGMSLLVSFLTQVQRYDPTYEATRLHFEDLARRYGNPIIILNLIKTVEKRPREMMLRREFANAVGYLNQILSEENHLKFIHWDFHKFAKSKSANVLAVLGGVASEALDLTGFYYSGKPVVVKRRTTQLSRTSTTRGHQKGGNLWQENKEKKSFHLVKWEEIMTSKKNGGLGIKNLKFQSKTLRMEWLWKYPNRNQMLWRKVIGAKYDEKDNWITKEVTTPYGVSGRWLRHYYTGRKQVYMLRTKVDEELSRGLSGGLFGNTGTQDVLRAWRTMDSSLRDLRANSGELSRIGSNNEILNSLIKQEREADNSQQIGKDNDENAAPKFQSGVLRTNCIDCLDRTNVAQYAYGLEALGRQLHAMGLTDRPKVDADSSIAAALMDMYQGMGDALAQQYGGSAAHNTVFPERQGKWKATTQSREFLKSIKRYYSNAYTDGEKQDAINLFLGYFQPQEGKPALWELDSDYYLHVSGIGDDLIPDYGLSFDATAVGQRTTLAPVPACREDFLRMKLTSFDKLLEKTCCHIKNVRLCSETDQKSGNSGVAPDAAEIQLRSPNWLFGQRKYDDSNSASKLSSHAVPNGASNGENEVDGLGDLTWISGVPDLNQEDIFERYLTMTATNEANGWYGGTLLGDQDESSEIYRHYAELIQGPAMEPFEHDSENEKYYTELLLKGSADAMDDVAIEAEMESAFKAYDQIGADLGIFPKSCKALATDPSQLTRWLVGEDKLPNV
ncbi:hypothetical protein H5410_056039 [Solanum commersonii]|uniref:SAC domain-containing protein n=1 Tax=Solanum commersonii TaxID=4109 RepID=A0A9J5WJ69_SOLCO|nr:hypothetical protein H5410_056039 [Solanum commersonii]